MKGKFTKMMAALALLVGLMIPLGMWGQTREAVTLQYTGNSTFTWVENTNYADQLNLSESDWSVTGQKNDASNMTACNKDGSIRLYPKSGNGSSITVSSSNGATISSISFVMQLNEPTVKVNGTTIEPVEGVYTINSTSFMVINGIDATSGNQVQIKSISINYEGGTPTPTTYTVTYDCNGASSGCPENVTGIEPGTDITLADAPTKTNYDFVGWSDGANIYEAGEDYTVNGNVTFTAQWTAQAGGNSQTLTFDLTSNPGDWPTTNSNTLTEYTYTLNGVDYTFALKNVKCNSGYLMIYYVGAVGLPAIEGYKLTTVVAHNSNGCSTTTQVGISSSASQASYIAGGAAQTWSSTGSTYTYNLTSTEENTMYYLYVTNKNAQLFSLDLTYEAVAAAAVATPTFSPASGTEFGNEGIDVTITCATENSTIYYTLDGSTPDNQSTLYSGVIHLTETKTVNAIAYVGTDASNVATATYTYVDPNAPGTVNNPYTVAQARAAIDAGTGITNVYATGVISQVDSYSSQYNSITYWISADGTTTSDQLEVYSGKGLNNTNFSSLNDIEVGATVVIYGTLKKYNDVYEFDKNNYLTSYTAPVHDVETPTFSPVAGTYTEAQSVTISCETDGATIYYTTDGTEPNSGSTPYPTGGITVSQTTTIKAIAIKGNDQSTVATATYHIGNSQANPYTVAQALAFNEYPTPGIYVHGIVSTAPTQAPTNNGQLTYYISVDGVATNQLEVYKGLGLEQAAFTAQDDIQVGDIVTVYGNVVIYNEIKEFATGNYLVSFERPQITEPNVITAGTLSHVTISGLWDGDTFDDITLGDEVEEGTYVYFSLEVEEGYTLESVSVLNANNEEVTLTEASESWYFIMPNSSVTINASATQDPVPPITGDKYVKVTSTTDLTDGQYLIVYEEGDLAFDGSLGTLDASYNTIEVAPNNGEIAVSTETTAAEFTIDVTAGTIKSASGFYIGQTSNSNGLQASETEAYTNTISIDEDGNAVVVASVGAYLRYNATSGQERFRYFKSSTYTSQKAIQLYKKVETIQLEIEPGQWYLIASPVGTISPEIVGNMTPENAFALYSFDQNGDSEGKEWLNYKNSDNGGFSLEEGKGYLYAHSGEDNVMLTFTGTPISFTEEDNRNVLELTYADTDLAGYNLMGNPFNETVWTDWDFYVMGDGEIIESESQEIAPMQGFFVIAEDNEAVVTLNVGDPIGDKGASVALNVNRNRGNVIDRARVRFGESRQLPKLQLFENSTKIYIPQNGKDYAVVRSEGQGELPVNFRAAENGTYTLSIDAENMDMNYLHLIDNMTGMDVDLLQTPSYTFEANVNDYESRFRLVFAGASTGSATDDSFAFYSNGSLIINNEGEATLQVVDLTGRILSSESVNGSVSTTLNAPTGVYMLRLINGDNVKVQKIVVR